MIASIETLGSRQTLEPRFVSKVLAPYFEHTTYLKEATMIRRATHGSEKPRDLVAAGEFHIGQSCYIQSTGHFNAVEFNICFNQLAYVTYAVRGDGMILAESRKPREQRRHSAG